MKKQDAKATAAEKKDQAVAAENAAADVKDAAATPAPETQGADTKQEEVAPVIDEAPPADACEVWGQCDPNSKICKTCPVIDACKVKTAAISGKKQKETGGTGEKKTRAPRVTTGEASPFTRCTQTQSQSFKIDNLLAESHTIEELMALTGYSQTRITGHARYILKAFGTTCKRVEDGGGKFHFKRIEAAA